MQDGIFEVECPCCGATLEIDAENGLILSHKPPESVVGPHDFTDAVQRVKAEENTRDQRFQQQFEAEQKHGQEMQKRFDGLLKKARSEGPVKPSLRDIDLD
jgi:hypothetical protein